MYEFKMPALGAEMTSGKLIEWRVKKGDRIKAHDIIALIDTDKAAIEAESFYSGVVEELIAKPGDKVPVGTVLALIREVDEGTIAETEVKKESSAPIPDHSESMKKAIAAAMAKSKREIPHYYLSYEIDLSKAVNWLETYNREHPVTQRLLMASLLIRATALALKKHPEFNGFFVDEAYRPSQAIHIGFAISLRGGGLIAPAILDAGEQTLSQTMGNLSDLVMRARGGKLRDRELSESTITITNLGDFGVDAVFGVIYPPQVALLGFGKIDSKNRVVMTLSGDHRVSNGLLGSRFLTTIARYLEEPEKL